MASKATSMDSIITLNVGGKLFQSTVSTLQRAGPTSLLSQIPSSSPTPHLIDRDPHLFSHLLFFLRHGRLRPHLSPSLLSSILLESHFYSLYPQISLSFSHPSNFNPFKLRPCFSLPLPGRDYALSVSLPRVGPTVLLTSHGGKLSFFDPALLHRFTILTPLPAIDSLVSVSESVAALGAHDYPGLHLYSNLGVNSGNTSSSSVLHWGEIDATATVEAIASANRELVFASFESARRTASVIVGFDVNSLAPAVEIGRKEVFGADIESAIPANRLCWVDGKNVLLAAGSHSGPAGVIGDVRLWDVRASAVKPVWEIREKGDCFADVAASDALNAVVKVGVVSGEVFVMDLRMLGTGDSTEPWKCIGEAGRISAAVAGRKEGSGCRVECCGKWVFVTRGAEVEVWTEIALAGGGSEKKVMRRNWVGRGPDGDVVKKRIVGWAFGGSRMALVRENERSVEVWDSTSPAVTAVTTG